MNSADGANVSSLRSDFIQDQVFSLTLMATAQRGGLYRENAGTKGRANFQLALRRALEELTPQYRLEQPSEERHIANIKGLANQLTDECPEALLNGAFRIGSAQKALNLFIKYGWCLDESHAMPPHCPVDGVVLARVKGVNTLRWTRMVSIDEYLQAIEAIRAEALKAGKPIAEWELAVWNEFRQRASTH